jgi:hypothetical protein
VHKDALKQRPLFGILSGHSDAVTVDELLSQDVRVTAVLSEFAQHVEVHPAQWERAAPVAADYVV